ncbi:hypothetical protein [Rickettsia helvetica]|uniref:Uncharacterized protein n=1 Tax=Rickettsia helvetica TaxID=35789 RepID=A0ABP0T5M3_RICHE|nr:hypothetical protein [Rickettsia helvetica]MCZ6884679.1 hypothetical protein [Rickettsia endosymbiont of Ixodes ricinus]MCZ6896281.1 hypothetical protein [Rickettsia endosymbiont of Ixodes ricinus]
MLKVPSDLIDTLPVDTKLVTIMATDANTLNTIVINKTAQLVIKKEDLEPTNNPFVF